MRIQYNVFFISGLIALASCGEKQTTTIGEGNTDTTTASMDSADHRTTDSIGKRLGVAMPSTAQNFTQIPGREQNLPQIISISGSRDGKVLAARTRDSILLMEGPNVATNAEIPADLAPDLDSNYFRAGVNFVFDLQGLPRDNLGNLKWRMDTYRISPKNHTDYGKRVSRVLLTLNSNLRIYDVQVLNDQIVVLTNTADDQNAQIYTFDSNGTQKGSTLYLSSQTETRYVYKFAVVSGLVNGKTVNEYWLYDPYQTSVSLFYRMSTQGTLLGTHKVKGDNNFWMASSTSGPLKIFAYVGPYLKTYAVPYPASSTAAKKIYPFDGTTLMQNVPQSPTQKNAASIEVLGDKILRLKYIQRSTPNGDITYSLEIFNVSTQKTLRTFSSSGAFLDRAVNLPLISLSDGENVDVLLPMLSSQPPNAVLSMVRIQGTQVFNVTGVPFENGNFFSPNFRGMVIPRTTGQSNDVKVLVRDEGGFGIITLKATGGEATFSGPFQLSTTPDAMAISRINNQTIAYNVDGESLIRSFNLTDLMENPTGEMSVTPTDLINVKSIPGRANMVFSTNSMLVKDNFLYGLMYNSEAARPTYTLMTLNLSNAIDNTNPVFASMTNDLEKKYRDELGEIFQFGEIQIATQPNDQGTDVPYLFGTLSDGSIFEIRMNSTSPELSNLTYWLRPENGGIRFGPAPQMWTLAGNNFYGTTDPGQIVTATKEQFRKSYVNSTEPSAKQKLIASLVRRSSLFAGDFGDRIGRDPRRIISGTSLVNCPGFVAKVLADGNFVVQKILTTGAAPVVVWSAINSPSKPAPGSYLEFNANGRVALLKPDRTVAWNAGTAGKGAMTLNMQQDGNLVVYDASAKPVWDSRGCLTGGCNASNALVPKVCEK